MPPVRFRGKIRRGLAAAGMLMIEDGVGVQALKKEQDALNGKRLLIVEDDQRVRSVVAMVFTRLGADVHLAGDGVEAIETIQKLHRRREVFNFALIDLMLPRMNGVAFLRYIRDSENYSSLPVLVMSGAGDERDLHECRCLGIDGFIAKPLNIGNVVSTVVRSINEKTERLIEETGIAETLPEFSTLGFPFEFCGFPRGKKYPLRQAYHRCPFCSSTFTAPRLCNRALKPDYNDRLAVGIYSEGLEKDFVEYPLTDIVVCPECLYAADRIGFYRIWTRQSTTLAEIAAIPTKKWEPVYFQVAGKIVRHFAAGLEKRHNLVRVAGDSGLALFRLAEIFPEIPRAHTDALIALDLAIMSAESIFDYYRGEPQARLRHKTAGYMLKKFYILGLMIRMKSYTDNIPALKQKRIRLMFECMQALQSVNDIDFNIIEERLYCITRRFYLADMLIPYIRNKEEVQRLIKIRKRCLAEMKIALVKARQLKSPECKTIERFMLPLENRMYDISKKEEEMRRGRPPQA